jgi:hypothetical protein
MSERRAHLVEEAGGRLHLEQRRPVETLEDPPTRVGGARALGLVVARGALGADD